MKFSIIICAKNEERNIKEMLESVRNLRTSNKDYEVIIVDDGSTDTTVLIAKNMKMKLIVVRSGGSGVAASRNTGIHIAKGEIIVFVDCDGVLDSNALNELLRVFSVSGTDIVQGNIWSQYYDTKANNWLSAWRKSVFLTKLTNQNGTLNSFNGRLLAIKRQFLTEVTKQGVSLFNSSLPGGGGEDRECGERMYRFGAVIRLAEKAIIKHKDPTDFWILARKKFKNGMADARAGVGESLFDWVNFRRTVLSPWKQGVPLWFSFAFWLSYILGNMYFWVKKNA